MAVTRASRTSAKGLDAPKRDTGTALASRDKPKSAAAVAGGTVAVSWGGARNWRGRASDYLSAAQAAGVIAATDYALRLGLPLNRHVTLHLEKLGVAAGDGAAAIGVFLKLHRQFLASRGFPFACVWVREDDAGDGSKGPHVHVLMHVPPDAAPAVTRRQKRWLRIASGKPYRAGGLHTSRIGGTVRAAEAAPAIYRVNLAAVVAYLLKGIEPGAAAALALPRHGEGGRVIGKRCGWSENIGAAARRRAGVSEVVRAGVF